MRFNRFILEEILKSIHKCSASALLLVCVSLQIVKWANVFMAGIFSFSALPYLQIKYPKVLERARVLQPLSTAKLACMHHTAVWRFYKSVRDF